MKRHRAFDPEKAGYEGRHQGAVAPSLTSHQRDGERSGRKQTYEPPGVAVFLICSQLQNEKQRMIFNYLVALT